MPYTHFGKQADVWKHIVLCQLLDYEKPDVYIETNSASAAYELNRTAEQEYGIYHFINKAGDNDVLKNSVYYGLEDDVMKKEHYLGSPGLAMSILGQTATRYLFFDIEKEPLENIKEFALSKGLEVKIATFNQDSILEVMKLLPSLPKSTFIHVDPYEIDKKDCNGYTYLDLFIQAAHYGFKCILWYGFMTFAIKSRLNEYIKTNIYKNNISNSICVDLILNVIKEDIIPCNPGILGSGLLAANICEQSKFMIHNYSQHLVDIYKNAWYKDHDGSLFRDIII